MMETPDVDLEALGRTRQFDALREFLQSSGYSDDSLCRRYGLERAEDFEMDRQKRVPAPAPESPADFLAELFLVGDAADLHSAQAMLGAANLALLESMGLLKRSAETSRCHATVALYPVEDLYIISDRWSSYDGSRFTWPEDVVYPAFIPNTRLFLRHLPQRACGRFLDLCGGTGIGALFAARRGAEQAWSGDISDRSTRFAEFNRLLNGIGNVQAITSDLYQGFEGGRFDAISAHPPYVPTLQPKWVFFSGGRDGEEIIRRIVEGLPDHLKDRGVFMALTMGSDRAGRPFEQRIREWLGERAGDFDVALLVQREIDPREFALRSNKETFRSREEAAVWRQLFKDLGITSLVYGFICIQKRSGARRTFTLRRQVAPSIRRSPWEWLLQWESAACEQESGALILDSPLHASQKTDFVILHRLEQGRWNPSSYTLQTDHPFYMECRIQPWMAHLISLCDGNATGRDVLRILIQNDVLPQTTPHAEFAQAVATLVSGGFVEVEGFRPPRAAE
ncbi:MAG: methyltransferase [Acidobacteriota bacterium]|nr:methyltransferase [Acidobacteriota bacterium]